MQQLSDSERTYPERFSGCVLIAVLVTVSLITGALILYYVQGS